MEKNSKQGTSQRFDRMGPAFHRLTFAARPI
jgi:hypothetical protein